jgi:glycosyltransferase involved in cell wall biosynthesis
MRVLHIGEFYSEIGGPYTLVMDLGNAIRKKAVEIIILSSVPKRYNLERINEIHRINFHVRYIKNDYLSFFWPSYSKKWKASILKILPSIDIVHVHGIFNHYAYVVSRYLREKPYILSLHGSLMENAINMKSKFKKTLYLKTIGHCIVKNAFMIHLLNEEEKNDLEKACFMNVNEYENKVRIIPTGINIPEFSALPPMNSFKSKFPQLRNKRYILFLGRLHPVKGLDILVEAYKEVAKIYNDISLVIVGPDNEGHGEKIKNRLSDYGFLDRTIFTGMLTERDKLEAFVDSELFVLPSYSEGSPMTVLEAMACETPVVISNRVGMYKDIERNMAGIIVETNPQSLFNGIRTLLDSEELRREFAKNGRRFVVKHHNIEEIADRMIRVYEEILK